MFGLLILGIVLFATGEPVGWLIMSFLALIIFIGAGIADNLWKKQIRRLDLLIRINKEEAEALSGNDTPFHPGSDFARADHPYSVDLDLFGEGSLFQHLNRTSLSNGKQLLADWMERAYSLREKIIPRQKAISELASYLDLRQEVRCLFLDQVSDDNQVKDLLDWMKAPQILKKPAWWKFLAYGIPVITLLTLSGALLDLLPFRLPMIFILFQFFLAFYIGRTTQKVHQAVSTRVRIMERYGKCLKIYEKQDFTSEYLKELVARLKGVENENPSRIILKLARLLNWMDTNLNMIASAILNGLLMFNLHMILSVERWRNRYKELVPAWFDVMGEMDALSSLANFHANHPHYCFPEPVSGSFLVDITDGGHPLIPSGECVTNSFILEGWSRYYIITGANMSGKSTFLRTVGLNLVLAMMGAPVFARAMRFTPVQLFSSIRTTDSLMKRESYFYAELKRLRRIIDELGKGTSLFILLDEILKGTNSADKQAGSIALIKQLMRYSATGMFATHDLALGDLITAYPDHITNMCFEIMIEDERMEIDYKLRPGVCRNLNASWLMEKMGIVLPSG